MAGLNVFWRLCEDPTAMIEFSEKQNAYELEIEEKKKEIPSLVAASYKVFIEPGLLNNLHFIREFDTIAPDTPIKNNIYAYQNPHH